MNAHQNLVDQCVQGEGTVQINVQLQTNLKKINILDVLKPAEDYIDGGIYIFNVANYNKTKTLYIYSQMKIKRIL